MWPLACLRQQPVPSWDAGPRLLFSSRWGVSSSQTHWLVIRGAAQAEGRGGGPWQSASVPFDESLSKPTGMIWWKRVEGRRSNRALASLLPSSCQRGQAITLHVTGLLFTVILTANRLKTLPLPQSNFRNRRSSIRLCYARWCSSSWKWLCAQARWFY